MWPNRVHKLEIQIEFYFTKFLLHEFFHLKSFFSYLHDVDETEERMNKQLAEAAKRENVLVLRLSAREQELQDVAAVAVKYRQQQVFIFYSRKNLDIKSRKSFDFQKFHFIWFYGDWEKPMFYFRRTDGFHLGLRRHSSQDNAWSCHKSSVLENENRVEGYKRKIRISSIGIECMEIHARFPNGKEADGPCSNSHSGGLDHSNHMSIKYNFRKIKNWGNNFLPALSLC